MDNDKIMKVTVRITRDMGQTEDIWTLPKSNVSHWSQRSPQGGAYFGAEIHMKSGEIIRILETSEWVEEQMKDYV